MDRELFLLDRLSAGILFFSFQLQATDSTVLCATARVQTCGKFRLGLLTIILQLDMMSEIILFGGIEETHAGRAFARRVAGDLASPFVPPMVSSERERERSMQYYDCSGDLDPSLFVFPPLDADFVLSHV